MSIKHLDKLYRQTKKRYGAKSAYDEVAKTGAGLDRAMRKYYIARYDEEITILQAPYPLDHLVAGSLALIGLIGTIAAAVSSAISSMASMALTAGVYCQ